VTIAVNLAREAPMEAESKICIIIGDAAPINEPHPWGVI